MTIEEAWALRAESDGEGGEGVPLPQVRWDWRAIPRASLGSVHGVLWHWHSDT
jgi:hypothetical protein